MDDKAVVAAYYRGDSLKAIALANHCRTTKIRGVLRTVGIEPQLFRGNRIGNAHRGTVKRQVIEGRSLLRPTVTEWAYISGIFDGEGNLAKNRWGNYRVTISQNGMALHLWLQKVLGGGTIGKGSSKKGGHFIFRLHGQKQVYEFCLGVRPFSRVKLNSIHEMVSDFELKYLAFMKAGEP